MAKLEALTPGTAVRGVLPDAIVTIIDAKWHGSGVVELTYKDPAGRLGNELVYRDREPALEIATVGRPWSFDGDGGLFKLVAEAHRIRLAYLFDPLVAVHTSLVEPFPHQLTAVYEKMLARQPLRFLLADDPGAGKTIMAGLLIKELLIRGDLHRCMVVCPGMLAEQWQDELNEKFHLPFEIMTNDKLEAARTGNWFRENNLVICRLDKLSRDEDLHAKLEQTDWDLIVCDEAHKMSASYFSGEVKPTKRYKLGQLLTRLTRHFLLMTATPHNGKEEDFQLFMALLDGDRFEGKFRDGVHAADTSDLMRRVVKEDMVRFDGTPLFPERRAYTVAYKLSQPEAILYKEVTEYVREEFNRVEALENEGRKGTVGFALTILQRRLASSPEAIYQSLRRRKERLEKRLREEKLLQRGGKIEAPPELPSLASSDDIEDLEDSPEAELEKIENTIADQATAAATIAELEIEIATLQRLENRALEVRRLGTDRKWDELSKLLQNNTEMFDAAGHRRKLILFTEHKDTLNYLLDKLRTVIGRPEAVVRIDGSMGREERKKTQESFKHDKQVEILIATDAAGEGINLQRAHLLVNYDLPWNPNRLEQRFGRIHRIGQTEVCHMWNMVAMETREGDVFHLLLTKLEEERKALGGRVFDVLGKLKFADKSLRELLVEAVRYGDKPEVKARLSQVIAGATDHKQIQALLEERALAQDSMDASRVRRIKEDLERAEARRLQPHFISAFFQEAFKRFGGSIHTREPKRFEITHVPAKIRNRDRVIGTGNPVLNAYERITFDKEQISPIGKALAAFVCPGHPLLDATIDLTLEDHRDLLKRGAILVDPNDPGEEPRILLYLEHSIQDARTDRSGNRRLVSRRMEFVELDRKGGLRVAGYAPYLDYRPLPDADRERVVQLLDEPWLKDSVESRAISHAVTAIVPTHLAEVRKMREELIAKTQAAVKDRLTKEINYWDHRAEELKAQEQAGKQPRMNWQRARDRADDLQRRLEKRMAELEQERKLSPLPPVALGGALILPIGLVARLKGEAKAESAADAATRAMVEKAAMDAVMAAERRLGFEPSDVHKENRGYDIESKVPDKGRLRFIEVKGRAAGKDSVTITANEIRTALNKPDDFILALVVVDGPKTDARYLRRPFQKEPDFGAESVNYDLKDLWARGEPPA